MENITYFHLLIALILIGIWLISIVFLRLKLQKSFLYLLLFSIFFIYIIKVLDYTLFQFQSLLILKHLVPGLMLNGQTAGESLNLIPLITLGAEDSKTSLLNILMLVPFGFGLPFIAHSRLKQVVMTGALFSIGIEILQFSTGVIAGSTFRVADINDVLFNTLGAAIGYLLLLGCLNIARKFFPSIRRTQLPLV